MARRPSASPTDTYLTRVVTYIPTEIIAAYVAVSGFVKALPQPQQFTWFSIVATILLLFTPFWIIDAAARKGNARPVGHAVAATLAFAAWVFATGGPFNHFLNTWYNPAAGSIVLVLVCLALPMIERAIDHQPSVGGAAHA